MNDQRRKQEQLLQSYIQLRLDEIEQHREPGIVFIACTAIFNSFVYADNRDKLDRLNLLRAVDELRDLVRPPSPGYAQIYLDGLPTMLSAQEIKAAVVQLVQFVAGPAQDRMANSDVDPIGSFNHVDSNIVKPILPILIYRQYANDLQRHIEMIDNSNKTLEQQIQVFRDKIANKSQEKHSLTMLIEPVDQSVDRSVNTLAHKFETLALEEKKIEPLAPEDSKFESLSLHLSVSIEPVANRNVNTSLLDHLDEQKQIIVQELSDKKDELSENALDTIEDLFKRLQAEYTKQSNLQTERSRVHQQLRTLEFEVEVLRTTITSQSDEQSEEKVDTVHGDSSWSLSDCLEDEQ